MRLVFWWIAANTLAWAGAITVTLPLPGLKGWIACGAIVGTSQWLAVHDRLRLPPAWIAGTCLAWVAGVWAGEAHSFIINPDPYWAGGVGGALAGIVQSWILWRRSSRAVLWVPASLISSVCGWIAGAYVGWRVYGYVTKGEAYLLAGAAGGAIIGAVSAPVLISMLSRLRTNNDE